VVAARLEEMVRLRFPALTATLVGAAALFAMSALGVAAAEAPTGVAVARTISVEGVAVTPIGSHDSAAAANGVYREGMAKAVADAQSKAAFLAEKTAATLGAVDSVIEDGGYIECADADNEDASYEGEQPDFGSGPSGVVQGGPVASAPATALVKVSHRPKVKRHHATAKKASAPSCNLTAQVSVVYAIG
jgi:hypothetical protein